MKILVYLLLFSLTLPVSADSFVLPVTSNRVTSTFGYRVHPIRGHGSQHRGIDIAAKYGAKVRAISAGIVLFSGKLGGYGELVVISHNGELTSHYGHLSKRSVETGQEIVMGQIIGNVGDSGAVTGSHLHFEIRLNGKAYDPEIVLGKLSEAANG